MRYIVKPISESFVISARTERDAIEILCSRYFEAFDVREEKENEMERYVKNIFGME